MWLLTTGCIIPYLYGAVKENFLKIPRISPDKKSGPLDRYFFYSYAECLILCLYKNISMIQKFSRRVADIHLKDKGERKGELARLAANTENYTKSLGEFVALYISALNILCFEAPAV